MATHRVLNPFRNFAPVPPPLSYLPTIISRRPNMLFIQGFGDTVGTTPAPVKALLTPAQQAAAKRQANAAAAAAAALAHKQLLAKQAADRMAAAAAAKVALQLKQQQAAVIAAQNKANAVALAAQKKQAAAMAHQAALDTAAKKRADAAQALLVKQAANKAALAAKQIATAQLQQAKATTALQNAKTQAQASAAQHAIAAAQTVIDKASTVQEQASNVLATAGVQPNAAKVVNAYGNAEPVTSSRASLPNTMNNVGTLPIGLPGQAPTADNAVAVISASNAAQHAIAGGNTNSPSVPLQIISSQLSGSQVPGTMPIQNFSTTIGERSSIPTTGQMFNDLAQGQLPQSAAPMIAGVDNKTLMLVGGAVLLILLLK